MIPVKVRLTDEVWETADDGAHRRFYTNRQNGKGTAMGESRDEILARDIAGMRGEGAGSIYFAPIKWHVFKKPPYDGLPDLGTFIDMKTTRHPHPLEEASLLVPQNQPPKPSWAYVLAVPDKDDERVYWLVGWEWGDLILKAPKTQARPAYTIKAAALRPSASLLAILRNDLRLAREIGRVADYVTSRQ